MIKNVGITTLWQNIKQMGWKIIITIVTPGFFLVFQGFAWYVCIDHSKSNAKLNRIILTQIAGWALSEIAPVSSFAGETFKGIILKQRVKSSTIVSSLVLYNTLHTFGTITIFGIGIIITLIIIKTTALVKVISIGAIIVTIIVFIYFVKKQQKGLLTGFYNFLMKIKIFRKKFAGKQEKIKAIDDELHHFWINKKKNYVLAYIYILTAKLFGALEYYVILKFIGYEQSFLIAFFLFIISSVIFVAAFFIPSQIGILTGGLNRTFKILNLDPTYGTMLGIFRRIRVIIWTLFGLLLIPFLGISINKKQIKIEKDILE